MSQGSGGSTLIVLLPLALIAYMFFSQRRRQRDALTRQQAIQVGDEVRTTSGLFGRVAALEETVVTLEVSPGVHLRYDRRAIAGPAPVLEPSDDAVPGSDGGSAPTPPPAGL